MERRARVGALEALELWNTEDAVQLERPTDLNKYGITVASRDWTVDTIVRQVEQGNIDLDPAFQRRNAWRDSRRSRLIESFVLGFPVPQIVLAENPRSRGRFIVIDGKQRLLTIAGLYLPNYRSYWTDERFSGLDVLKALNRVPLDTFLSSIEWAKEQRQLTNSDIKTTIITGFQDEDVLYEIFYRINTGYFTVVDTRTPASTQSRKGSQISCFWQPTGQILSGQCFASSTPIRVARRRAATQASCSQTVRSGVQGRHERLSRSNNEFSEP